VTEGGTAVTSDPGGVRSSTLKAIGETPLVRLNRLALPVGAEVLVKLEYFSPTGSYKDRMALAMIEGAERRGELRPGMSVVEFTGGSTGSSLAFVCTVKGYPLKWSPRMPSLLRSCGRCALSAPTSPSCPVGVAQSRRTSLIACGRSSRRSWSKTAPTERINSTTPTRSMATLASGASCLPRPAPGSAPSVAGLG
jgi:Pyridoxal-phosphate dependent enzyme